MDDNIYLSKNFEVIWTRLKISTSPPHQKFLTATPKVALSTAFTQTWKHGYFHSSETESAFKNQSWFTLSKLWPIQIGWFGSNFQMDCRPPKGAESHQIVPWMIQCVPLTKFWSRTHVFENFGSPHQNFWRRHQKHGVINNIPSNMKLLISLLIWDGNPCLDSPGSLNYGRFNSGDSNQI